MSATVPTQALRSQLGRLLVPSVLDVFFLALLLAAFAHPQGLRALLSDGDTGWHIRTGELVLETGHAPVADPFSFSRFGQPWFAWEWLSDVVLAETWRWRGLAGVAALAGAVLALAATALLARMLRRGCGLWIGLATALAAVSASSVHYLARPHIFSILLYTVALWILAEDRLRRGPAVWLLAPLTALWVNLHAGFVAWLATLGLLLALCAAERDWSQVCRYGGLAALCSLASLLNPYGWQLHLHVARYLSSPWIMEHVQEFQSPSIRSEGMIVFALLLLATVALAPQADRFDALLVLFWGFLALRSARHVPFFAIAAAPVLASGAAANWARLASRAASRAPLRICWELAREYGRSPRVSLWLGFSAAAVMVAAPGAGFPDTVFPVRAVERNIRQLTPPAAMPRILTSDQWADYLIYRLYPRQRVFFDGRSDFFGPAIGSDYRQLLAGQSSWRELLDRYQFDLALLPRDWPLSASLDREPGWRLAYRDSVAVLYARDVGRTPWSAAGAPVGLLALPTGLGRQRAWTRGSAPQRVPAMTPAMCVGTALRVAAVLADLRRRVPDWLTAAGAAAGVVCAAWGGWHGVGIAAAGALAGFLPFHWCGAVGGGDAKLMAAHGALLGPSGILLAAAIPCPSAILPGVWIGLPGGGS